MYSVKGCYLAVLVVAILITSASTRRLNWRKVVCRLFPCFSCGEVPDPQIPLPFSSPSVEHSFRKAAVCSDGSPCSCIARDILKKDGSAVDAAVAALFCNGVVNMHSMGLGGGFMMTVYNHESKEAKVLDARETAPGAATRDMFAGKTSASQKGALAAGVPGELRGYWEAQQKYGRLKWNEVVEPALKMCKEGYIMSEHQSKNLGIQSGRFYSDPNLREWFVDSKNDFKPTGSLIQPKLLCETLGVIAKNDGNALHDGPLTKTFVDDIQKMGGIITEDDMRNYKPVWSDPIKVKLGDDTLYSTPPPGSGVLLAFILKILEGFNITPDSMSTLEKKTTTIHRMVEAFKYAYAKRTELGDPNIDTKIKEVVTNMMSEDYINSIRSQIKDDQTFEDAAHYGAVFYNPDDHGTAHISILAPDGDAVAVTSTVNLIFGAGVTSERTGIVLNSGMNDFSLPGVINYHGTKPSPANFIQPGKRSMSSTCPTIIVDKNGDVRMVLGAAGGAFIPTAVSWVIIQHLWLGKSIKDAVDASRIHHQLYPMEISYEYGVIAPLVKNLRTLGHKMSRFDSRSSGVFALAQKDKVIYANADYVKVGEVCGID
ncbi:scoloptoxin SSD14-like [Macrosteles quadrilineatus]|uniref:scoloptoxin SSD14-like n=1 Tax=Macrosteles quadrilineatus TaxID=74068 RepID=UPI0023E1A970|nr:scoloptoxin SSD14-like [Macrosteles quadrilineatus]